MKWTTLLTVNVTLVVFNAKVLLRHHLKAEDVGLVASWVCHLCAPTARVRQPHVDVYLPGTHELGSVGRNRISASAYAQGNL